MPGARDGNAVDLETPHASGLVPGQHPYGPPLLHRAGDRRPRHDDAMAMDDEGTVDGQPEVARGWRTGRGRQEGSDLAPQRLEALAGQRRDGDDRRPLERGVERQHLDLLAHGGEARRVHQIGLGDHEDTTSHAEEVEDVQVLFGLRHDAVVGGHGEEDEVHAVGAGQHVADEALVPRHVDDTGSLPTRRIEEREVARRLPRTGRRVLRVDGQRGVIVAAELCLPRRAIRRRRAGKRRERRLGVRGVRSEDLGGQGLARPAAEHVNPPRLRIEGTGRTRGHLEDLGHDLSPDRMRPERAGGAACEHDIVERRAHVAPVGQPRVLRGFCQKGQVRWWSFHRWSSDRRRGHAGLRCHTGRQPHAGPWFRF